MNTSETTYPLALRDVPPSPDFERLPIPTGEGLHTGGPWFDPAAPDLIWKPLDARPFVNADVLVATREAEILDLLAGRPGFPRNWTSAVINGRGWIIRCRAEVLGPDTPPTRAEALEIEQALRVLNAAGWCLNDHVAAARDAETGQVSSSVRQFIALSCVLWRCIARNLLLCYTQYTRSHVRVA